MDPSNSLAAQYDDYPRHRHPQEEPWNSPASSPHPYPPAPVQAPYTSANSSVTFVNGDIPNNGNRLPRDATRTPSPTPSEAKELKTGVFSWEVMGKWRFWIRREWLCALSPFTERFISDFHSRVLCRAGHYPRPDCSHDTVPQANC